MLSETGNGLAFFSFSFLGRGNGWKRGSGKTEPRISGKSVFASGCENEEVVREISGISMVSVRTQWQASQTTASLRTAS